MQFGTTEMVILSAIVVGVVAVAWGLSRVDGAMTGDANDIEDVDEPAEGEAAVATTLPKRRSKRRRR